MLELSVAYHLGLITVAECEPLSRALTGAPFPDEPIIDLNADLDNGAPDIG